ncbi:uncharacterized protein METZ01_LOCUS304510, partial [marine metagenome]
MILSPVANKLMMSLTLAIVLTLASACTKEVTVEKIVEKEVIKEVFIDKPAEQGEATVAATATEDNGPKIYKLGIFEDLTTTNYWSYLGPDATIWNSYVLGGGKPGLYSLSDQRFDWIPSAASEFPTPVVEETIGGTTLWTTEVPMKKG